jgi:hypothetical protein
MSSMIVTPVPLVAEARGAGERAPFHAALWLQQLLRLDLIHVTRSSAPVVQGAAALQCFVRPHDGDVRIMPASLNR